jgi:hypothetical protein
VKKVILSALVLAAFVGCASGNSNSSADSGVTYEADKVLGRSDSLSARPDWVKETVTVQEKGDKVQFVGLVEVPGDSRATAAFKMSDAAARAAIAGKIETTVVNSVQTGDAGLNIEDQNLKTLIHEISQVSLKNVDVANRYWEKAERTSSSGSKSMVMKAFSLIEVKKDDLKKMMLAKAEKADAPADLKNKVEDLVRAQWSNVEE